MSEKRVSHKQVAATHVRPSESDHEVCPTLLTRLSIVGQKIENRFLEKLGATTRALALVALGLGQP